MDMSNEQVIPVKIQFKQSPNNLNKPIERALERQTRFFIYKLWLFSFVTPLIANFFLKYSWKDTLLFSYILTTFTIFFSSLFYIYVKKNSRLIVKTAEYLLKYM